MQNTPIRSAQIVTLALAAGLALFLGVTVFFRLTQEPLGNAQQVDALAIVVPVVFAGAAVSCVLLRRKLVEAARQDRETNMELARQELLPGELLRVTIIGAALAEGPGLLACVTILLGGPWFLVAFPIVSIGWIASLIPTRDRVEALLRESH
ncbi:MAG: hypothetical protein IPJ77_24335 [Planctomycetes bacterium]|nr:hypothetical protein [Planctomycetota bacterium]